MKTFKSLLILCFLAVLVACSEDAFVQSEDVSTANGESVDLISMVVPNIEMDATTRSLLYEDGNELKFKWEENDTIGVFPLGGPQIPFPIVSETAGKNKAIFDGGFWSLRRDVKYAAYYPYRFENRDGKHIYVDYTGQTQDNYINYDFLATGSISPENGELEFNMTRLSNILKINVKLPQYAIVQSARLTSKSYKTIPTKGYIDLSGSTPTFNATDQSFSLDTKGELFGAVNEGDTCTFYFVVPAVRSDHYIMYLFSDPENWGSSTIYQTDFYITNDSGNAFEVTATAKEACLTNTKLISLAESNNNITFEKEDDGSVNVNKNRSLIEKVERLDFTNKDRVISGDLIFFKNLKTLICPNLHITSLDLSNFAVLDTLICNKNYFTSLDLSKNKALTYLDCSSNNEEMFLDISENDELEYINCSFSLSSSITSIDLSKKTKLQHLKCAGNSLKSLDVSNNLNLNNLLCGVNPLSTLDVSKNTELTYLDCGSTNITKLDLYYNKKLEKLVCYSCNKLTSISGISNKTSLKEIDVSKCTKLNTLTCNYNSLRILTVDACSGLTSLYAGGNNLSTLDVSNCYNLKLLQCHNNVLSTLDVSKNTSLETLWCHGNLMSTLDVTKCYKLGNDLFCGNQYKNSNKVTSQDLTLTLTATQKTKFDSNSSWNSGVILNVQ